MSRTMVEIYPVVTDPNYSWNYSGHGSKDVDQLLWGSFVAGEAAKNDWIGSASMLQTPENYTSSSES